MTLPLNIRVVLVRPQGPINIGLVARACANLGVEELRLVAPECAVDALEARMFANHAQDLLSAAPTVATLPEALDGCDWVLGTTARRRRDRLPSVELADLRPQATLRGAQRLALVFGSESDGLNREELQCCDAALHLETPGPYPSYNLSHAVAITLYGVLAAPSGGMKGERVAASHGQLDRLHGFWVATLDKAGYFRRTDAQRFAPKLRRLIGQWRMTDHDVHTLWGMLAHIQRVVTDARQARHRRE